MGLKRLARWQKGSLQSSACGSSDPVAACGSTDNKVTAACGSGDSKVVAACGSGDE